jgi:hypothetical protein
VLGEILQRERWRTSSSTTTSRANLGWQSRLRWILRPGNDLFLVFNQGWGQQQLGGFNFRRSGTRLTGKVQYTFRF